MEHQDPRHPRRLTSGRGETRHRGDRRLIPAVEDAKGMDIDASEANERKRLIRAEHVETEDVLVSREGGIALEAKASYESIDAHTLALLPWAYRGKQVMLIGLVTGISRTNEGTWIILQTGPYPSFAIVVVRYPDRLPGLERLMRATVYGVCAGTEKMPSELRRLTGLTMRRPLVRAEHVEW
ncbi:MAG: hypothetical protein ACE5JL_10230 [Dehalococcoidia bacterium]